MPELFARTISTCFTVLKEYCIKRVGGYTYGHWEAKQNIKLSIHTTKGEFQPAAHHPDFCLIVEDDLQAVKAEMEAQGIKPLTDIVERRGSRGLMRSLYVRDPDGNLVEMSCY